MQIVRERILIREAMQHRSHPPRKSLHLPHSPQAGIRVRVESLPLPVFVKINQRRGQHPHVGDRKIQSFRAGWRDDVRRIARQKQISVAHRLRHKAPHRRHAFLQDRPVRQRPSFADLEARAQFASRCDRRTSWRCLRRARTADTTAKAAACACSAARSRAHGRCR